MTDPPILDWLHLSMRLQNVRGQSAHLVDHAERHLVSLRVGTSVTEDTASFLANRRMAKSQQVRWSRGGADLLLQVHCTVHNGTLGSGFGHKTHGTLPRQSLLQSRPGASAGTDAGYPGSRGRRVHDGQRS